MNRCYKCLQGDAHPWHDNGTPGPDILTTIAGLTAAMVAQDSSTQATAEARRRMVRQAVSEGHTFTAIATASGITRQRVAQLAERGSE